GIRDFHVTGVQTCALPIYSLFIDKYLTILSQSAGITRARNYFITDPRASMGKATQKVLPIAMALSTQIIPSCSSTSCLTIARPRSEERRVGKEWRCRGARA